MLDPAPFYAPPHVKFRMARLPDGECSASECGLICSELGLSKFLELMLKCDSEDDYFAAGYGRIIMVPRVKLAYDKASSSIDIPQDMVLTVQQKVYDIIHPERRNLTAIRGYKRIGGLPDDPHTDPQDRSWYGPHDRLFTEEENDVMNFIPGPEYGT